jgi:hypothetical protein
MSELSMLHPVFNNVPNEIKELSTLSLKKARFLIVTWSPSNVSNAKTHISNVTGGNFFALHFHWPLLRDDLICALQVSLEFSDPVRNRSSEGRSPSEP